MGKSRWIIISNLLHSHALIYDCKTSSPMFMLLSTLRIFTKDFIFRQKNNVPDGQVNSIKWKGQVDVVDNKRWCAPTF
jgi:hypothetical protein